MFPKKALSEAPTTATLENAKREASGWAVSTTNTPGGAEMSAGYGAGDSIARQKLP
jgi:hypothetical protein